MTAPIDFIRDDIKAMTAYHVADLPADFIKLDSMETRIIRLTVLKSC